MNSRTLNTNITDIRFKNNHVVYENFIKCTIKDYEFNLSYNPTLLSGSQAVLVPYSSSLNGDVFYNITGSRYFGILKDFATGSISGSEFSPYVTTVGLYNDSQELLAIAKLSAPMPISSNSDMTFLIKYDTQWTPKPYFTPTPTPSVTPFPSPSVAPDCNLAGSAVYVIAPSVTPSITPTISVTPTVTPTPSIGVSTTPSVSVTPTATPSITPSPSSLPVFGLLWTTEASSYPQCAGSGWTISNNNQTIRFDLADSSNCGGTCDQVQSGSATATITVGPVNVNMALDFDGSVEQQDANFERIEFRLNNVLVASATSRDLNLGCAMGSVDKTFVTAPPYLLLANNVYTFKIDFTSGDSQFHVDSFYEVDLGFTPA